MQSKLQSCHSAIRHRNCVLVNHCANLALVADMGQVGRKPVAQINHAAGEMTPAEPLTQRQPWFREKIGLGAPHKPVWLVWELRSCSLVLRAEFSHRR